MSRRIEHFGQGLVALLIIAFMLAAYARGDISTSNNVGQITASTQSQPIISATTTNVKATAGVLRRVIIGTGVASATIKLFNVAGASCTGTPGSGAMGTITLPSTVGNPFFIDYYTNFSAGICVVTSGATNVTVVFD